jgi:hypothetical protein
VTISYWASIEAMGAFTGGDPTQVHHLERDAGFLIELPRAVQVLRLRKSHGVTYAGHEVLLAGANQSRLACSTAPGCILPATPWPTPAGAAGGWSRP